MTKTKDFSTRLVTGLASSKFFWICAGLLVVQALWLACTGLYPMAFDEDFHLGVIRLYAHHPYPFWAGQPAGGNAFGAVARDPSYLYQYLMSFPYRLIAAFTDNQTIQVLLLRLINIGLFASGLVLYRRLLLKMGGSRAMVHMCLLLFVLLPMVPLLAAQINYDNLLLPLTASCFLLVLKLNDQLNKHQLASAKTLLQLLILCLLTSVVKYAFLPVFAAIVGFVLVQLIRLQRSAKPVNRPWRLLMRGFMALERTSRWGLLLAGVVAVCLFTERYGINLIRYHEPVPECGKVLSVKQCSEYPPWIRDYNFAATKPATTHSPIIFMEAWVHGMWLRTYFAVGGPGTGFDTKGPLALPAISGFVAASLGIAAFLLTARRLWRRYDAATLWLFMGSASGYLTVLWLQEYKAFLHTGMAVAINGRYLLPLLLPMMLVGGLAIRELIQGRQSLKLLLATVIVICSLWGGGALTYILRSNDTWYWPSPAVRTANHAVQRVVGPLTPGSARPLEFIY